MANRRWCSYCGRKHGEAIASAVAPCCAEIPTIIVNFLVAICLAQTSNALALPSGWVNNLSLQTKKSGVLQAPGQRKRHPQSSPVLGVSRSLAVSTPIFEFGQPGHAILLFPMPLTSSQAWTMAKCVRRC